MSKPEDIPQDVWDKADLVSIRPDVVQIEAIARAILAAKAEEREALIVLVEQHPFWAHRSPRADLVAAIRKREG